MFSNRGIIMAGNSTFRMWGERGLIATFFADLYQKTKTGHMEIINDFLKLAQFWDSPVKNTEAPEKIHFIIEPDFSEFGHPDAIFAIKYPERRVVIIVEAKRTDFQSACWPSSRRGQDGFNSKLNGQLELDYRLAIALSEFRTSDSELAEPNAVANCYGDKR